MNMRLLTVAIYYNIRLRQGGFTFLGGHMFDEDADIAADQDYVATGVEYVI